MRVEVSGGRSSRSSGARAIERTVLLALALAAPALCLGQEAPSTGAAPSATPSASTPATGAPAAAAPAAELPGTGLPGAFLPIPGLTGAGATGLSPMPAEYTNYGAAVGVGGTDDVNLSSTNPKAQALTAANLFFDLIRTGSRLELTALGNFSDIDYLEHAYGNQVLGRFDGLGNLTLWTNHLTWLVRDDYGDQQINPLESMTPTNLQRVNVFYTGPDLKLEPTLSSFVELQALYSRNTYQDTPFDGQSELGSLRVGHQLSAASSLSLVGQVQQESFENRIVNTDYQLRQYYGDYNLKGARTAIDLQGGVAQANDTGSWKSSPLARLSVVRDVSPFSTVSLGGGRDYTDPMGSFASLAESVTGDIPIGPATQTTGAALHTYGNASWGFHRLRTTIDLFGGWARAAYDQQPKYDFGNADIGLSLGRDLTPRLSANMTATVDRSRYANQGFTNDFGTAGGGLVYRPGEWVVLYGRYDHQFSSPSGEPTRGLGYGENRVFVMIGYYPHSTGTAAPAAGMGGGGFLPGPMP